MPLNFKNIRKNREQFRWFLFDVFMVFLALINIMLILFDFSFAYQPSYNLYFKISPEFTAWYAENIHAHFIGIDLVFVSIFFVEFVGRWIISIKNKEYKTKIAYPIVHWYDLLSLIPIGSFRFLRILRVFSILIRMNKMEVINLRKFLDDIGIGHFYGLFLQEVSDRVIINVLHTTKNQVNKREDVIKDLVANVLKPNNDRLMAYSMKRVQYITQEIVQLKKDDLRQYIFEKVNDAIADNKEMKRIGSIPGLGALVRKQLDHAIGDITYNVIVNIIEDVATGDDVFSKDLPKITDSILSNIENDEELEQIAKVLVNDTIDMIRARIEGTKITEQN